MAKQNNFEHFTNFDQYARLESYGNDLEYQANRIEQNIANNVNIEYNDVYRNVEKQKQKLRRRPTLTEDDMAEDSNKNRKCLCARKTVVRTQFELYRAHLDQNGLQELQKSSYLNRIVENGWSPKSNSNMNV